jgi:hypothetical protein
LGAGSGSVWEESRDAFSTVHVVASQLLAIFAVVDYTTAGHAGTSISSMIVLSTDKTEGVADSFLVTVIAVGNGFAAEFAGVVIDCVVHGRAVETKSASSSVFMTGIAVGHS